MHGMQEVRGFKSPQVHHKTAAQGPAALPHRAPLTARGAKRGANGISFRRRRDAPWEPLPRPPWAAPDGGRPAPASGCPRGRAGP